MGSFSFDNVYLMMYHVHMTRLIQITAYVRDEADLAKWKALGNKTTWLHEHLNTPGPVTAFALQDIKKGQAGTVFLTEAELAKQFNSAGGKEVITEIAVSDPEIHKQLLKNYEDMTPEEQEATDIWYSEGIEPTITPAEDVA